MMAAPVPDAKGDQMTDAPPLPPAVEQFLGAMPAAEPARALRTLCLLILAAEPRLEGAVSERAAATRDLVRQWVASSSSTP